MQEELLTLHEAAQILSVPPRRLHQWIKEGALTPLRVGGEFRIRPEDLRLLSKDETAPGGRLKKRILVLEDDPLVAGSLRVLLEKSGFEVLTASIGLAALDLAGRSRFDLVISDIRMPGMNGIQALQAIRDLRAQFGAAPVPEIILTAYDDPAVRREAEAMGVRDFVLKPFEIEPFLALVKTRLGVPR